MTFGEVRALAHSRQLALTDELTGLGNRRAFYEQVQARTHSLGAPATGALLLLDLDRFKEVNDSLGHHAGDDLLCQVADRLGNILHGSDDLLARLGGDEFAIYLSFDDGGTASAGLAAEHVAERVHAVLEPPFTVEGVTVRVDASVGIAHFPVHGREVANLLRAADIAMYQAKSDADRPHVVHHRGRPQRRRGPAAAARGAARGGAHRWARRLLPAEGRLEDAARRRRGGAGALGRTRPEGLLLPDSFLPLAEQSGLMRDLTTAVLEQSLDQVKTWRDQGRSWPWR